MKTQTTRNISILGIFFLALISFRVSAQDDTGENNRVYIIVPQMPTFPVDLDSYMQSHLQYPQSAVDRGIQGTVNVSFVITKKGDITQIALLSSVSPDLDSEAVRLVRNMPSWSPGVKDGVPVNVKYNLPVYFQLKNLHKQEQRYASNPTEYNSNHIDTNFVSRSGLYIDPYFGYGEGGPKSSSATAITLGNNVKYGIQLSYIFSSSIGVSAGLQVQTYNFNYGFSNALVPSEYIGSEVDIPSNASNINMLAGYNESISYSFTYVQLPLLARYISSPENKAGFYVEAGLMVNYLANSKISGIVTQTQFQLTNTGHGDFYRYNSVSANSATVNLTPQDPEKLTLAAHIAVGAIIPFSNKISLILAVSPDLGITSAGNGSNDVVNFGASKFYVFGNGAYGSFNSYTFDAKLLIKLSGASHITHK